MSDKRQLTFIDFFAGIGGFRHGLELAGMKCVGFCENDKFAVKSYRAMYDTEGEWYGADISKLGADDVPQADIWTAGSPCQNYAEEKVIPKFKPLPLLDKGLRSKTSG